MKNLIRSAFLLMLLVVMPAQAAGEKIRIGWNGWSFAEVTTKLAERMLRDRLGYDVELVFDDIANLYQRVAEGDLDLVVLAWLPNAHGHYMVKHDNRYEDYGAIFDQARLGWVVPDYVPVEVLKSFDDLRKPEVKRKLRGRVQGIGENSGTMRASPKAIEAYDLGGYTLMYGSDVAMSSALRRAIQNEDWVVATAYSPHWVHGKWKLRYLEDPQKKMLEPDGVHALARIGFGAAFPRATQFLRQYRMPIQDVEQILLRMTSIVVDEAVDEYIAQKPETVRAWLAGIE